MKLYKIEIENFRRIKEATIHISPAAFIVGPNNSAKSSIIAALEALLSLENEKLSVMDIREDEDGARAESAVLTAYFKDIETSVSASRGFRGRVINGNFVYRKTITRENSKPKIETKEYPSSIRSEFEKSRKIHDLVSLGLDIELLSEVFGRFDSESKLSKDWQKSLPEVLDFDMSAEPTWIQNPGGIPGNVLSRLPRLIHIPALTESKEIESGDKKHALGECLSLLFEDLIHTSPLAGEIQDKLDQLEQKMNPGDDQSLLYGLIKEINKTIDDVFPKCGISIDPSLQNILDILRPKYDIKVFSNISTGATRQGTGLIRTCVFAMLRYHAKLKIQKDIQTRPILVAFEEPELFLHPSAANLLRDTIYSLGESDQIVCTTHSPWMIDLSRDLQSITKMTIEPEGCVTALNFGVSTAIGNLSSGDKDRVRMIQIFDNELSRIFFSDKVVVVEGDSDLIAITNTIRLLPEEVRKTIKSKYQVVKARGKATIISLVKYLKDLGIDPIVMHDSDDGTPGAVKFNRPIAQAIKDPKKLIILEACLEDVLGYPVPSGEKPFAAYEKTISWKNWSDVPEKWQSIINLLFPESKKI